jgi:anti-sigma factor (TIGR02949 family)
MNDNNRLDRYTCEEVFRRLDDYLDRELTVQEMELVRQHLETCEACASEHRFQASVIQELRSRIQRVSMPPSLMDRISKALKQSDNLAI